MRRILFGTIPTMRCLTILMIFATTVLAAPKDLRPRYGNGWTGFGKGTTARLKMTGTVPGRVPFVQVTTSTLKKVEKTKLTIEQVTENQLTDAQKRIMTVPPTGDAGFGEKQTVRKLENETIKAGGRDWTCTRQEITITGPKGKRVITDWISVTPLVRIKRLQKTFDAKGKSAGMTSTVLNKAPKVMDVGGKKVLCVGYAGISKRAGVEQRSETWTSRQVPGDLVSGEIRIYQKGKLAQTLNFRTLRFSAK
jgi:hypothetical protein